MTKREQVNQLKKEMLSDMTLPLRRGAKNLVLGEGNFDAEVMLLGEGPGYWEDLKGRPFVGAAGRFLDQLLHSIKLPRQDVFISNVVCYRPPENRDPLPEEIVAFQPYIDRLIEIIGPKVIVTLGRFSMGKFLPGAKISAIHGKLQVVDWKDKETIVVPMYHPAAGLRREEIKAQIFEDFKTLSDVLKKVEKRNKRNIEQMQLI